MTIDEDERKRISDDAVGRANLENRVRTLEGKMDKILYGLGAAALLILTTIWDQLKTVVFR